MRSLLLIGSALMAICCGLVAPATAGDKEQCVYTYVAEAAARDELIKACTRLIESKNFNGDELALLHNARGFSYYVASQYDHAIADANEVIGKIAPLRPQAKLSDGNLHRAHYIRGESSFHKKDYDRTIADQTVVIQIRRSASALQSRGQAHYEKGEFDRAIDDFSDVIRENPKDVLALAYRAQSFEKKGEWAKALADARQASELEPNGYSQMSEQTIERVQQKLAATGTGVPAPRLRP
jgi:tetratricopeptide (TPR) repeat protein